MPISLSRADQALVPRARNLARRVPPVLTAFLFLALWLPGRCGPLPPAPPPFLVGKITAAVIVAGPGNHPVLTWSISVPDGATSADYMFLIRQRDFESGIHRDISVPSVQGQMLAPLSTDPDPWAFELWAIRSASPSDSRLLDTTTFGAYLPTAAVTIRTEDPYPTLPRTRADRPIFVDLNVQGIFPDPTFPESSRGVNLLRHVQSYGATGTGDPLDRDLATLLSQTEISSDGMITVPIPLSEIPGANREKIRGEERFTIISKPDDQIPASIISSRFVQIWPVADASISGIAQGQIIGASVPQISFQLNDLYPSSTTWGQVYKGGPQAGIIGTTIPGSSVVINGSVPANHTIVGADYGSILDSDGIWTMELLTQTPFGTDRLAYVTFTVRRAGMSLADWRQAHFGSTSSSGDGADENDHDRDGIADLIEFAFGLDPKQNSAGQLPVAERIGDQLTIRFTAPEEITGILHGAEWSSTLQPDSWLPVANTGELPEHVFSVPANDKSRLFLRLKATAP
jgi:hypothetical protein